MLSNDVQDVLRGAIAEVQRRRHELLTVEHLLFAFSLNHTGELILEGSGASADLLREQLEQFFAAEFTPLPQESRLDIVQTEAVQRVRRDFCRCHARTADGSPAHLWILTLKRLMK